MGKSSHKKAKKDFEKKLRKLQNSHVKHGKIDDDKLKKMQEAEKKLQYESFKKAHGKKKK